AIHRPVIVEEAVTGAVVAVELVLLAVLLQLRLVLIYLLGSRRGVLVAEEAQERAREVLGVVDRRDRRLGVEVLLLHHHAATPELDAGVDALRLAGVEEREPAARARADAADLCPGPRLGAQPFRRGFGVAHRLRVGYAAFGAHLRRDVVRFPLPGPLEEVVADRRIAVVGELARELPVELVPARVVVYDRDARERSRAQRPRNVRRNLVAVVAGDRNGFRNHAFVSHGSSFCWGLGRGDLRVLS